MPEFPEVQTIVNQLKENLVGKTITGLNIRLPKLWYGDKTKVVGAKIIDVWRRAKMIIIKLNNDFNLVVHLKMTGQLIYGEALSVKGKGESVSYPNPIPFAGTSLPGKTTHIVLKLNKGALFFNDMRQFGWMKLVSDEELKSIDEKHGPEVFGDDFTVEYLTKICANWGRPIKLLLLEQSKIAGIGNIYANEALWYAGISPMKRGRELARDAGKVKELWEGVRKVLEMGLKYGGSSATDEAYVNAYGMPGKMQEHTVVYQKNGQDCPRCNHKIVRSKIGGRGTFFCPKCQN